MTSPLLITSMMAGQRLDRLFRKLCKHNPAIQLGHIFKAIRQADIRVKSANEDNFHKSSGEYMLQIGDTILIKDIFLNTINSKALVVRAEGTYRKKGDLQRAPRQTTNFVFKDLIIRQTDDRLVIDKPAGISMHPSENNNELNSLHDLLKQYYSGLGFAGTSFQPNFCYRLDKDTSGVCIVGKTFPALQHLNAEIRDRKVDKVYMAWVHGTWKDTLRCTQPLKRVVDKQFGRGKTVVADDGQEAATYAYVVKTMMHPILGDISLCEVTIQTGRMHQIRVHLAHAGHHIVGDMIYGQPSAVRKAKEKAGVKRQLLHCYQYSFIDLDGSKISFKTPSLTVDFQDIEKIPPK